MTTRRTLRPGGPAARRSLMALLGTLWSAETIRPSRVLIVAVPSFADGPALDPRAGGFAALEPEWGERRVRVSDVLLRTAVHGGTVWLLTCGRPESENPALARLRERVRDANLAARLRLHQADSLPVAGIYGDGFALSGPVAFADDGPDFAGETVTLELGDDRLPSVREQLGGFFA